MKNTCIALLIVIGFFLITSVHAQTTLPPAPPGYTYVLVPVAQAVPQSVQAPRVIYVAAQPQPPQPQVVYVQAPQQVYYAPSYVPTYYYPPAYYPSYYSYPRVSLNLGFGFGGWYGHSNHSHHSSHGHHRH